MYYVTLILALMTVSAQAHAQGEPAKRGVPTPLESTQAANTLWPGNSFPLPLQVNSADELAFKSLAERQYLIFNLLVGGKVAFDRKDFDVAASTWEALAKVPNVDPATLKIVAPLLQTAKEGAPRGEAPQPSVPQQPTNAGPAKPSPRPASLAGYKVSGVVSGGGRVGPGAAVLWLKRADGPTPTPKPARPRVVDQKEKAFRPHVLVIPVGTEVMFRNTDDFFHNVFSISETARFDTGLYKSGKSVSHTFTKPGPVELLCNIHASMYAYIYVVDSPYYAQPDARGNFTFRALPEGRYTLFTWHESSSKTVESAVEVKGQDVRGLVVKVAADLPVEASRPDKYGKARQMHLGY